jgi:hypothetical protein
VRLTLALPVILLAGCAQFSTNQSADVCLGLCLEVKSTMTKGRNNEKPTDSDDSTRRDKRSR